MCAIDAMGAAFTFHQDTEIHSACASCNEPVHIRIVTEKVAEYSPKNLHALTFCWGTFQLGRILLKCHEFLQQCRIRPIRYGYEVDAASVIKADMDRAVKRQKAFEV